MELSDKKGVQIVVSALARLGLKEVVITPGSRNAPFVISFNRHSAFHCTSIRDERSAGFFALGKALASGQPVALVCTSGSASLNYAPAIAEAYYQRIPLLVITADRPKEWTGQGNGQTINQTDIYRNYIRAAYELRGDATENLELWHIGRCVSEGFNKATVSDKGPVHFNVPLEEPLYGVADVGELRPKIFREILLERQLPGDLLVHLSYLFSTSKKVLVLVGQSLPDKALGERLIAFSRNENVIVLSESTSNIHHQYFVEHIDRCITNLNASDSEELAPDLLITLGGAIVSKRIKKFLRTYKPLYHWNIHLFDAGMDTYQCLTTAIPMNPAAFLEQMTKKTASVVSDYRKKWLVLKEKKQRLHYEFSGQAAYSDFYVFQAILREMPENTSLHLSNSSPVRYAQLFNNERTAETWSNRGTSGIDGCTSTAVGAASAAPDKDFLLITGEVAFHYDVNALWNESDVRNLSIIVIHNGGGGIFRIIEGPNMVEERSEFLETAMEQNIEQIAAHYGWRYLSAKNEEELHLSLKALFEKDGGRTILEVFTDAEKNPEVLREYWNYLKTK